MNYRISGVFFVLLAVLSTLAPMHCTGDDLSKLSGDGITVFYPAGMETQAKTVLSIAEESFKPSLEMQQQIVDLLEDSKALSQDITKLLGAEEKQDEAQQRLVGYKNRAAGLVQSFSNIKLVKKTEVAGNKGIDGGIIKVAYDEENDAFRMMLDYSEFTKEKLDRSFFPVVVNPDGSIRSEKKLAENALQFLGAGGQFAIAPVHETVSYLIAEELKLFHPFTRWFNEGVSAWVTERVVSKADPELGKLVKQLFAMDQDSEDLRGEVNLRSWRQTPFQYKQAPYLDPKVEKARSKLAIELVSKLLEKDGDKTLPDIMGNLKYAGNPGTDAICAATDKATGKNCRNELLAYMPQDVRKGIESGEWEQLNKEAEDLAMEKKWEDAVAKLRLSLAMNPEEVNALLNLAWLEREVGERLNSEIDVFLCAALLEQDQYSFHMYAPTIEGHYVMARLAILLGNLEYAKKFLEPVLKLDPEHEDAKRAMAEIQKLEQPATEAAQ